MVVNFFPIPTKPDSAGLPKVTCALGSHLEDLKKLASGSGNFRAPKGWLFDLPSLKLAAKAPEDDGKSNRKISFSEKAEAFRGFCCLFEGRGFFLPNYMGIGLYYPMIWG